MWGSPENEASKMETIGILVLSPTRSLLFYVAIFSHGVKESMLGLGSLSEGKSWSI